MASTVKKQTLRVTIQEDIVLNGTNYGSKTKVNFASINEIYKRIVTCPANVDTTIFKTAVTADVSDAGLDLQDIKYIRVTNLDDSNSVNLNLQIDVTESDSGASTVDETATILLGAGESFIMGAAHDAIATYTDGSVQTNLHDLESILVDPSANAVDMEIFVASV
jgi:hypothetical protein